ncbi:hypothetical protein N9X53_07480 [Mariniblastus sp.]|nr:hypothetical protein [Mariniblastus sp.]
MTQANPTIENRRVTTRFEDCAGLEYGLLEVIQSKSDNVNDHRAGTNDLNIEKHMQVRLRVHRIVILPILTISVRHFHGLKIIAIYCAVETL